MSSHSSTVFILIIAHVSSLDISTSSAVGATLLFMCIATPPSIEDSSRSVDSRIEEFADNDDSGASLAYPWPSLLIDSSDDKSFVDAIINFESKEFELSNA